MTDPILFADAEAIACKVLDDALTVTVVRKIPATRPAEFVLVHRTGGPKASIVVDASQLTVESWAASGTRAMAIAQQARAHLNAASGRVVEGVTVYLVEELSGPGHLPDPISEQPRVTQTFRFPTRGV